jgi:hypothetical protein
MKNPGIRRLIGIAGANLAVIASTLASAQTGLLRYPAAPTLGHGCQRRRHSPRAQIAR